MNFQLSKYITTESLPGRIIQHLKALSFPGFEGEPIYRVLLFFLKGIQKGSITTRASSVAFNMFLALFPGIIFFFTLIPYIPIDNFQTELLALLKDILPKTAYDGVSETIEDIILRPRGGLMSIGFVTALYFSTNGVNALIEAFNASYHSIESRTWLNQRLISILLVILLFFLVTSAVALIAFSETLLNYLVELKWLEVDFTFYLITFGKWIIILALFFFAFSSLYYLAPAKKTKMKFSSAGASLATLLTILSSLGFSYFVNNFGQYNKLYGSIGTLIVVLFWLYLNALGILIGFELNTSLSNAHKNARKALFPFISQVHDRMRKS